MLDAMKSVRIALAGEFSSQVIAHQGIGPALGAAAAALGISCDAVWLPTPSLENGVEESLSGFQGIWCVPNTPYASEQGALNAIRFAREKGVPFLGTCGGFQHAIMEIARDVLGLRGDHAEVSPEALDPVVAMLSCWLVEKTGPVIFVKGSRLADVYGHTSAVEGYHCRFGPNPKYEAALAKVGFEVCARDEAGEVRAMELAGHPFFLGTLFQPERSGLNGIVHPVIKAFLQAAVSRVA